ncbi:hypothetical protein GCM10020370_66320 [Paenibacillus hodogayensis]
MKRLEVLTSQTVSNLHLLNEEQLAAFVEEREQLIDSIKSLQPTAEQSAVFSERVKAILQYDSVLVQRMTEVQLQGQAEMNRIQNAKKQKMLYDSEYSMGSVMFDKRK